MCPRFICYTVAQIVGHNKSIILKTSEWSIFASITRLKKMSLKSAFEWRYQLGVYIVLGGVHGLKISFPHFLADLFLLCEKVTLMMVHSSMWTLPGLNVSFYPYEIYCRRISNSDTHTQTRRMNSWLTNNSLHYGVSNYSAVILIDNGINRPFHSLAGQIWNTSGVKNGVTITCFSLFFGSLNPIGT